MVQEEGDSIAFNSPSKIPQQHITFRTHSKMILRKSSISKRTSSVLKTVVLAVLLSSSSLAFADKLDSDTAPTVVEAVAVADDSSLENTIQERSDNFVEGEDQLALESQIAEERDGFGGTIVAAPDSYDSFSAPNTYGSGAPPPPPPAQDSYGSPVVDSIDSYGISEAPPIDSYGAPSGDVISSGDSYGSPIAPPVDSYGSPQAEPQGQYNSPQAPPRGGQPNYGPIPVPLPVPVRPSSLVLPQGPGGYKGGPPRKPNLPPNRPQYRPPPPPRPPSRPQYRPPPPPPKRKPIQKRPPPPPQYKPKPQPPKQQYRPAPPKPQYRPPQKPQYQPAPPKRPPPPRRPAPPRQPQYSAVPNRPPPPPPKPQQPTYGSNQISNNQDSYGSPDKPVITTTNTGGDSAWPQSQPEMPKITSLDVTCEKNLMKVFIEFDKPFYGIIFSKGHYSDVNCVHLPAGLGRTNAQFDVSINTCGTTGNTKNGLYGYGTNSGSGTFFENTIVIQYDPQVQEVWDQARKLRCTWHDQYEKSVTFRPFPVDMLDVVRADFAGDNVGCWMQIQVGKGPWASEVSGLVKIGQTMTMVLAIKDDEQKFDMMVRNCMAHDGKRAPIQLVDQKGCVTRPKLMSKFTKIKNFGASASVLSYAHFQAFKFPDSMEVHFQCTIQICRYRCPDQCDSGTSSSTYAPPIEPSTEDSYGAPIGDPIGGGDYQSPQAPVQNTYGSPQAPPQPQYNGRRKRSVNETVVADLTEEEEELARDEAEELEEIKEAREADAERLAEANYDDFHVDLEDVGVQKVIQVVSSGDLTFAIKESDNETVVDLYPPVTQSWAGAGEQGYICMSTPAFAATLVILLAILVISCLLSAFLCLRHRSYYGGENSIIAAFANPVFSHKKNHF